MKLKLKAYLLVCIVSVILGAVSCKKEKKELRPQDTIENYDKMVAYLAFSLHVETSRIVFDERLKEFTVTGTDYRQSLASLQEDYNSANEYKARYEGK